MNSNFFQRIGKHIGVILMAFSLPLLLVGYMLSTARFQAYGQAGTVETWRQAEAQFNSVFDIFMTGILFSVVGCLIVLCQKLAALWQRINSSNS